MDSSYDGFSAVGLKHGVFSDTADYFFVASGRHRDCTSPGHNRYLNVTVRCRKCPACRSYQRRVWYARTMVEIRTAPRAWFVTLTFAEVLAKPYVEVQKWLKRLRSDTKAPIKYICAQEYGTLRGRLHFHLIVTCPTAVDYRSLRKRWRLSIGLSHAVLVEIEHVRYVVNYIGSDSERTRASAAWGKGWDGVPF